MHTAVIYRSHYGATRQYAQWIAQSLNADVLDGKGVHVRDLECYTQLIFGGGLYAGGISGAKFVARHFDRLCEKRLLFFTVGLADPALPETVAAISKTLDQVFDARMRAHIAFFHLRGQMDYAALSPVHRAMMGMLKRMLERKDPAALSDQDRQLLATYGQHPCFMDQSSLAPLLACAREESPSK